MLRPSPVPPFLVLKKGWKILANDWFAYVPYIICNDSVGQVLRDRMGNVTQNESIVVLRIYDHIADPGRPTQEIVLKATLLSKDGNLARYRQGALR